MPSITERYERELVRSVIPFWERHCVDRECGGYFNMLDRDGSVYDTEKHMWMQWRIVYMFATLADTRFAGESRGRWIGTARHGFEFLTKHGRDENGSYYFELNRQGLPVIAPYNIGSEFFAAMACAALYKATGDRACLDAAHETLGSMVRRADNPKGRWNKRLPSAKKWLFHETNMATINLGLVMRECAGITALDGPSSSSIGMILDRFWRPELGVLLEHLSPDLTPDLGSCEGRVVCPGHALESAWFILKQAEAAGDAELVKRTCAIMKSVLENGWDERHGGIFYFTDALGRPPSDLAWDMKLWWVHCEALVAAITGHVLTGDRELLDWFYKIDEWTWKRFPDPEYGEWFGYLNRRGEPTLMLKGGKWKTFFHLPRALLECSERLAKAGI
jgi:N-acylglucosamine 2-epimerase